MLGEDWRKKGKGALVEHSAWEIRKMAASMISKAQP